MSEGSSFAGGSLTLFGIFAAVVGVLVVAFLLFAKDEDQESLEDDSEFEVVKKGKAGAKTKNSKTKAKAKPKEASSQKKAVQEKKSVPAVQEKKSVPAEPAPAEETSDKDDTSPREEERDGNACDEVQKKSPKKKRRRKPAKTEVEDEDDESAEEAELPTVANVEIIKVSSPQPGEWTSIPQKKKLAPDSPEAIKEQKRLEKLKSYRKRETTVIAEIKRLEDSLSKRIGSGGGRSREEEDCKALEARTRLQNDLDRIKHAIARLTNVGRDEKDDDSDKDNQDDEDWAEWDHWDAWGVADEWNVWGQSWEEEEWYEGDWWETPVANYSGKGRGRRGGKRGKTDDWWADAYWDAADASWEAAGEWWEGCEWNEDESYNWPSATSRRRAGRRRGKGDKGDKSEDANLESNDAQPDAEGKGRSRRRAGKGKGDSQAEEHEQEHEDGELDLPSNGRKGKSKGGKDDSKGKGKGKDKGKGKGKGKSKGGRRSEDSETDMQDWLRQRKGVRNEALTEDDHATNMESPQAPAAQTAARSNEIPRGFRDKNGQRQNWGDAESSDEEDHPIAVRSIIKEKNYKRADVTPSTSGRPADDDSAWDEDLVAFMGEAALKDEAKFEEQLKYVPTWVREKALRRRKQLMRPGS